MADYSAGASLAFDYNAASGQTADFTPSGSNLAAFAIVSLIEFGSKTINECRLGGSSGSVMTRVGSDYSWNSTACLTGLFRLTGVAAALTNAYSGWAANPLQSCISVAVYSGVDQTTPASDYTENSGLVVGVTTTVATITIPNCVIGQRIAGCVSANADNVNLTTFTAVTGEGTLRSQSTAGTYLGPVWVDKLATSTGDNTLQVNVNSTSSATLSWSFRGFRINDAAGGGGEHDTSGSLVAQAATLSGAADRTNSHNASGSLVAQSATLAGAADRTNSHNASGSLVAQAATLSGAADRTNSHNASGSLVAQSAALSGAAMVETPTGTHDAIGELEAQAATMSGSADLTSTIETSGALAAQAASLTGAASRTRVHATSGSLVGQAASVAGMAAHTEAGTHATEGELVTDPATMTGTAVHVSSEGPLSPKFLGGGHKNVKFKPMKREPASQEILQPEVTNIQHVKPPVRKHTLLDMLDELPVPEPAPAPPPAPKAAPAPAPKPKPKAAPAPAPEPTPQPVPPAPTPVPAVDLSPLLAANEALTKQVAALSEALAQTQATLQQVLESQAKAAELQEKVAKATEDAERRARNARRAEAIARKLLED